MIRLVIADDQSLIRSGLRAVLDREPDIEVVGEAADGAGAVEACRRLSPDVVLMDIRMPVLDGLAATAQVMSLTPRPKVIILTTYDLDEYVYAGLRAGASGFLLKDAEQERILDAIRTVAHGEAMLSPSLTLRLIEAYVATPPPYDGSVWRLTQRETEVLSEIARGRSNAEVAGALYLSEATVKSHVAAILTKLGARDRLQAVVAAYEAGLVTPGARGVTRARTPEFPHR